MFRMETPGVDRRHRVALAAVCLALSLCLTQGCGQPEPHSTQAAASASGQKLPFHPDVDSRATTDGGRAAVSSDPKLAAGVPFRAASPQHILPSGTLLTVQLDRSLSTPASSGDLFTASVAAPLVIDGQTLLEGGTAVTGQVQSAQSEATPNAPSGSGYFELTLRTITVAGRQLAVQTSSLFARGSPQPSSAPRLASESQPRTRGIQVQKGRRLTFRLTSPLTLDSSDAVANSQPAILGPQ